MEEKITCEAESVEKELSDYKKSTTLWSSVANNKKRQVNILLWVVWIMSITIAYLLWNQWEVVVYNHTTTQNITVIRKCELPKTWSII